jgi:S2P endopeptidase
MITLSLYFFNLLPLPHLDGTELLAVFIESVVVAEQTRFTYDVESQGGRMDTRTQPCERWRERIITLVHCALLGTLILYMFLASMNALR